MISIRQFLASLTAIPAAIKRVISGPPESVVMKTVPSKIRFEEPIQSTSRKFVLYCRRNIYKPIEIGREYEFAYKCSECGLESDPFLGKYGDHGKYFMIQSPQMEKFRRHECRK